MSIPPPLGLSALSRRAFLETGGALAFAARGGAVGAAAALLASRAGANQIGPLLGADRVRAALRLRIAAAQAQAALPLPPHPDNGDEALYADKRGSFSKALPHDGLGEVDPVAYAKLIDALTSGDVADFEAIPMGANPSVKLTSPMASYAFELCGPDGHHTGVPPAPAFASARRAAEGVEVMWECITRDVPFAQYGTDPLIAEACADLSALSDYAGPKSGGAVTPETIFRHSAQVGLVGPYVSQFFWKPVAIGSLRLEQKHVVPVAGQKYGIAYADWLAIQNGAPQAATPILSSTPRYVIDGHDLGETVHNDPPYQWAIHAALILFGYGPAAVHPGNPYASLTTQKSFVTWGGPHLLDFVQRGSWAAMKATWFHKWLVNRTLRPEAYAGRVHNHLTGAKAYDLHPDALNSAAAAKLASLHGTHLLPLAFPEGSPTHPSYAAGHATFGGTAATLLKAFFDESFVLPDPVVPNSDGSALVPYTGPALTVRNEADKMASNIAFGRNAAGVHYRSDAMESMLLGEAVAVGILKDYKTTCVEPFGGFTFTGFQGNTITI